MRIEGFSFLVRDLLSQRLQPLSAVRRWSAMALTLGEAFGGWKHDVLDLCEIARKCEETCGKVRGLRRRRVL